MTNWPFVSACHAGRLAGHPTPVGSAEIIYVFSSIDRTPILTHRSLQLYCPLASVFSPTPFSAALLIALLHTNSTIIDPYFSLMFAQFGIVSLIATISVIKRSHFQSRLRPPVEDLVHMFQDSGPLSLLLSVLLPSVHQPAGASARPAPVPSAAKFQHPG